MQAALLDVVCVYANPIRWQSRDKLQAEFEERMLNAGVRLTTVEVAYGDRPWYLKPHPKINRVQLRAKTLVWVKEMAINVAVSRLPPDWKYVAWIDADIAFRFNNWASEAVHALQQYDLIQLFSDVYDLGPQGEHIAHYKGWVRQWWQDKPVIKKNDNWWTWEGGPYTFGHCGYAWGCTRAAFDALGGLMDFAILGAADHHMAGALLGEAKYTMPGKISSAYQRRVYEWQDRAVRHVNQRLGFLWGTVEHYWHGRKDDRGYISRWGPLVKYQFNPDTDIKRNSYGLYELVGNKPGLTHAIDVYFRQRYEDGNLI